MRRFLSICIAGALVLTSTGCASETKKKDIDENREKLVWCMPAQTEFISDEELAVVTEEINRQIEDLDIELQLVLYDTQEYQSRISEKIASDGRWDLAFTGTGMNDYIAGASGRSYAPLKELLNSEHKRLYQEIPDYAWDTMTVNGDIYAVPNRHCWAAAEGYYIRKDLAEKYDFQCQTDTITPIHTLEMFFRDVTKEEDLYGTYTGQTYRWSKELLTNGLTGLGNMNCLGVIREEDDSLTVLNQFETQEFREYCDRMKKWRQEGYFRKDGAVYSMNSSAVAQDKKDGHIAAEQLDYVAPGMERTAAGYFGYQYEFLPVVTSQKMILSSQILRAATAVNAKSDRVEKAVQLIERVHTDSDLYNTFLYGIEGRHYNMKDSGQVSLVPKSGYGSGMAPALDPIVVGNEYNSYTIEGSDKEIWNQSRAWEESAARSKILGFHLKTNKISQEIADVAAVIDSELRLLDTGSVEVEEFLPQFLEKLEDAGSARIIEECQKQLTQWNQKRSRDERE